MARPLHRRSGMRFCVTCTGYGCSSMLIRHDEDAKRSSLRYQRRHGRNFRSMKKREELFLLVNAFEGLPNLGRPRCGPPRSPFVLARVMFTRSHQGHASPIHNNHYQSWQMCGLQASYFLFRCMSWIRASVSLARLSGPEYFPQEGKPMAQVHGYHIYRPRHGISR